MESGRAPPPGDCKWKPRESEARTAEDGSMLARPAGSIKNHLQLRETDATPQSPGTGPPGDSAPVAPNPTFGHSGRHCGTSQTPNTIDPDHHDMRESSPWHLPQPTKLPQVIFVVPHRDFISNAPRKPQPQAGLAIFKHQTTPHGDGDLPAHPTHSFLSQYLARFPLSTTFLVLDTLRHLSVSPSSLHPPTITDVIPQPKK